MEVLIVLTSHHQLGNIGRKTGFWLQELAARYYVFKDAGIEVTLSSPKGVQPPLDPKSNEPDFQTDASYRFETDAEANSALANTVSLESVRLENFDATFYPGGHGPLWDLAEDENSIALITNALGSKIPVALVCHAPGVLGHAKNSDGSAIVEGKKSLVLQILKKLQLVQLMLYHFWQKTS